MRSLLLLAVLVPLVLAAEPDPRAQAKATWLEAAQASDVWTCLQLEEWAREQKPAPRLPSALGGSLITGSPIFAFPEQVRQVADLGSRILVATDRRLYSLAPDGRPLAKSVPLHPVTSYQYIGYAGRATASVQARRERAGDAQIIEVGTAAVDGRPVMRATVKLATDQTWTEDTVMSDDGSAVALSLRNADREGARARSVAIVADGRATTINEVRGVIAVGRKGAWLATRAEGHIVLLRGDDRRRIASIAAGPGPCAVVSEGKPTLFAADGSEKPLNSGLGIGRDPEVATVGEWLVLKTGNGAKAKSQGDLLGDGAGVEVEQPCMLALWRWNDLAADPGAKPALTLVGDLSIHWGHPAGLLVWDGKAVDVIDLTGTEPQRSRCFDASFTVTWAYADQGNLVLFKEGGVRVMYGPDKAELWSGKVEDLRMVRRDCALGWTPGKAQGERVWQLFHLSPDALKRPVVPLAVDPVAQDIEAGFRLNDYLVGRHDGEWRQVGYDGKLIDRGSRNGAAPRDRPGTDQLFSPQGRFYVDGARIHLKATGRPAEAARRLQLQDAWRFGGVGVALLDDRTLVSLPRRRPEPVEVGRRADADRFGMAGKQAALLSADGRPVVLLGAGPSLIPKVPESAKPEEMPAGIWRIEDSGAFTPPRGRQMVWDAERVGFQPLRLRSPDDGGLFVITRSVLIELEADVAKLVGKDP